MHYQKQFFWNILCFHKKSRVRNIHHTLGMSKLALTLVWNCRFSPDKLKSTLGGAI